MHYLVSEDRKLESKIKQNKTKLFKLESIHEARREQQLLQNLIRERNQREMEQRSFEVRLEKSRRQHSKLEKSFNLLQKMEIDREKDFVERSLLKDEA